MAILWVDGFDYYATHTDMSGRWSGGGSSGTFTTGRFGGQCVVMGTSSSTGYQRTPALRSSTSGTATFGFAFKLPVLPANTFIPIYWDFGASGYIIRLQVTTAGLMTLVGPTMTTNSFGAFVAGTWYYVEVVIPYSSSCAVGSIQLWINGTKVSTNSATFNTTSNGSNNWQLQLGDGVNNGQAFFDDVYVADEATGQQGPFGDSRVCTLYPGAAGSYTQWTPLSGTNFSNVNQAVEDGNTSYVKTATVGNRDSYLLGSLPSTPASIYSAPGRADCLRRRGGHDKNGQPFAQVREHSR